MTYLKSQLGYDYLSSLSFSEKRLLNLFVMQKLLFDGAGPLIRLSIFLISAWLTCPHQAYSQRPVKKDYIVLGDSALTQGKVYGLPINDNTELRFSRTSKDAVVIYSISDVTEFRVSERVFFSRTVDVDGVSTRVFLELLPHPSEEVKLWRLNGKMARFYIETEEGFEELGDVYRQQLRDAFGNEYLSPLIAMTEKSELSLNYLAKTAMNLDAPRTFTKLITVTPWVGFGSQTVKLVIPDSDVMARVSNSTPFFGVQGEIFLTHPRNLSLNLGLAWSRFDNQDFVSYTYDRFRYDSDIYLDFTLIQIPILARYYLDYRPNKIRFFAEAGYSLGMPTYEKLGVFQAKFESGSIVTSSKTFELSDSFGGLAVGVGMEKYLSRHCGVALGIRQSQLRGDLQDSVNGLTFYLGYKF